ncbi:glycosyltransferase [Caulobacter sp. 17J80-11]|uniref:CgeB family protein n=1 Tax=Caulobacter sp. 17J80-11 TaxID=2763502 RepID=UPI001653AC43|nr:glycosyltransferase [Caulobacter sp. 17J80-11]
MTGAPLDIVVFGLSLSSSWGNGHATTWRALLKAFAARGHEVLFLEREAPWYAAHRDLEAPDWGELAFYSDLSQLEAWRERVANADAVIVGSYVPDGAAVGRWVQRTAKGAPCFYDIDTPVTLAKLERGEADYLTPDLIPGYRRYFSFTGGPTLERLERRYGSPAARALYCSADEEIYRPTPAPARWDLSYIGTYSADRQPLVEALLVEPARRAPALRCVVAGPQYPPDLDWPDNVQLIRHVPPADHPAFYAASRYTLNLTRRDMARAGWSPSVRLFEAAACGTPIISDTWEGLDDLFTPGEDIFTARTADDVLDALLSTEDVRQRVGAHGRKRILDAHTAAHRAYTLEVELRAAAAQPQAAPAQVLKLA